MASRPRFARQLSSPRLIPPVHAFPLQPLEDLLAANDRVEINVQERIADFASISIRGVQGLRGLVLQGRPSLRALVEDAAAAGATLTPDSGNEFLLRAPLSFSPGFAVSLADGSELRLGRFLGAFEKFILFGTWFAVLVVAALIFLPRFPGRRSLATLLLFLVALSIGLSFVASGNAAFSLAGVSAGLQGRAVATARLQLSQDGSVQRVRDVAFEPLDLEVAISGVPVPAFVGGLLRDLGTAALKGLLAKVDVTVSE
jgi:hypothetical protein